EAGGMWSRYVRYIGAGAVAVARILTVVRNLPTMWGAFAAVARGFRRTEVSEDLPGWFVVTAIALVPIACALVPGVFAGDLSFPQRAVCAAGVAIFGVLFVAVAARIVGLVGVSSQPTSAITLVTLRTEGVLSGALPWAVVLPDGGLSNAAMPCATSGLASAIGVYPPLSSMAPIFLGGAIRAFCDRDRAGGDEVHPGVLAASG